MCGSQPHNVGVDFNGDPALTLVKCHYC